MLQHKKYTHTKKPNNVLTCVILPVAYMYTLLLSKIQTVLTYTKYT